MKCFCGREITHNYGIDICSYCLSGRKKKNSILSETKTNRNLAKTMNNKHKKGRVF